MSLTYDKAGRKLTMNDPDMGFWQYSYNALGGMTRQEDAKNQVTCLYYDELNRPRGKDYFTNSAACPSDPGSGYEVTYNYDSTANGNLGKGRRTSMTDASGSTNWYYDSRGRVWKETKIISGTSFDTEWTYNLADLPATMKYPDGEIVTTGYNNNMLPTDVSGADNYVPSMTYDSAGRLLTRALGNGLTQTYDYYPWNQQGGRLHTLVAGNLQNLSYAYDSVGNIISIADSINSQTQSFDYDALDRLTSASANGEPGQGAYDETYQYDPATGNLKVKGDMTLDYLDSSHVHAVTNANGNTYSYDSNGNQTTRTVGGQTIQFGYNAENKLVSVTGTNLSAQFTYNGDGQRVKSVVNGEIVYFVGGHYEFNDTTNEITKYYFSGGARIALRKYIIPQTTTLNYILGDHLGSTNIITNATGALVVETRYKPWGEVRYATANQTLPTRFIFTGQYSYINDDATDLGAAGFGLMYFKARWYDPTTAHFSQADTVVSGGVQGADRYAYGLNNPLKYTDPSGHTAVCVDFADNGECLGWEDQAVTTDEKLALFGVILVGEWSDAYKLAVLIAIQAVAIRISDIVEGSVYDAFKNAFNITSTSLMTFTWGSCDKCNGAGGYTYSPHDIRFASMSALWRSDYFMRSVNNVVHELGHAFNHANGWDPVNRLSNSMSTNSWLERGSNQGYSYGFASTGDKGTWVQNPSTATSEVFADQFLGWVFNQWERTASGDLSAQASERASWMDTNMSLWLTGE
ncbi:MAG: RHS repeat-associated core domain-containing protein [Anaerolineales bacterium]|nr:MAG: RHS repeat-associated core domain-containing protein [Anaerolineales bacterium]